MQLRILVTERNNRGAKFQLYLAPQRFLGFFFHFNPTVDLSQIKQDVSCYSIFKPCISDLKHRNYNIKHKHNILLSVKEWHQIFPIHHELGAKERHGGGAGMAR